MKKTKKLVIVVFILLFLAGTAIAIRIYFTPKPLYLEMKMCDENGKVYDVVVDAVWRRRLGKPWRLCGTITLGDKVFTDFPQDKASWEFADDDGYFTPEFVPLGWTIGKELWPDDSIHSFHSLEFGDETYYFISRYWDEDGDKEFDVENNIYYLGPADSKEEYDRIWEKWCE